MKKNSNRIKKLSIALALVVLVVIIIILLIKVFGGKEYTIFFNTNGGSTINSLTIKKNEKISQPTTPTKEGYIFDGWYYNDKKFDFNTKVTKDITLEARWKDSEINDLILDTTTLSLTVGESKQIKVTLTGELKDTKLVWKSSNKKIATVDSKGNIKSLKEGKITITVATKDGEYSKTINVSVKAAKGNPVKEPTKSDSKDNETDKTVAVNSVSIKNLTGKNKIYIGGTVDLQAVLNPNNASNKKVTWTVDKKDLGIIAADGLNATLVGKAKGTIKVTVKTDDGNKIATIEIEVLGNSTSNNVSGSTSSLTSIYLQETNNKFHIKIKADDMDSSKIGTHFYATKYSHLDYETNKQNYVISEIVVQGGNEKETYECTSDLTIKASGSLVSDNVIEKEDGKIYFGGKNSIIDTTEVDLKAIINAQKTGGYKKQIKYKVSANEMTTLTADIEILNRGNQNYLADKEINITMNSSNLICNTIK